MVSIIPDLFSLDSLLSSFFSVWTLAQLCPGRDLCLVALRTKGAQTIQVPSVLTHTMPHHRHFWIMKIALSSSCYSQFGWLSFSDKCLFAILKSSGLSDIPLLLSASSWTGANTQEVLVTVGDLSLLAHNLGFGGLLRHLAL